MPFGILHFASLRPTTMFNQIFHHVHLVAKKVKFSIFVHQAIPSNLKHQYDPPAHTAVDLQSVAGIRLIIKREFRIGFVRRVALSAYIRAGPHRAASCRTVTRA